jgi:hypothetical protein
MAVIGHAAFACNGYRSPKHKGKPAFTNAEKCLWHRHVYDSWNCGLGREFTSRSSRYLNRSSNLMGHDHPNKPANGKRMIRRIKRGA